MGNNCSFTLHTAAKLILLLCSRGVFPKREAVLRDLVDFDDPPLVWQSLVFGPLGTIRRGGGDEGACLGGVFITSRRREKFGVQRVKIKALLVLD